MRTIKIYFKRAPFYNALIGTLHKHCHPRGGLEESLREATTNTEWSYVACQRRAQSHAATVPPSIGSRCRSSRIAENPNSFPGLIQHHLLRADVYQMVLHRPI